jgi:trimeric autotransporter adhesin
MTCGKDAVNTTGPSTRGDAPSQMSGCEKVAGMTTMRSEVEVTFGHRAAPGMRLRLAASAVALALGVLCVPTSALAQFVAGGSKTGAENQNGGGSAAITANDVAIGINNAATSAGGGISIAIGLGSFSPSLAGGFSASAISLGANARADNSGVIAIGGSTNSLGAAGAYSTAIGASAQASGDNALAIGGRAAAGPGATFARANNSVAVGSSAVANQTGATALGSDNLGASLGALAAGTNSTAIGANALAGANAAAAIFANNGTTAIGAQAQAGATANGQTNATAVGFQARRMWRMARRSAKRAWHPAVSAAPSARARKQRAAAAAPSARAR